MIVDTLPPFSLGCVTVDQNTCVHLHEEIRTAVIPLAAQLVDVTMRNVARMQSHSVVFSL
jgi:hypothetical protein